MEYIYTSKTVSICQTNIANDIATSEMSDKLYIGSRWDEDTAVETITFTNELGSGDKAILDAIVANF